MADAYLNLAEQVLTDARRPLRPREIVEAAYLRGLSPQHLRGPRQDKTLHARLSEDIARGREASRFIRTGPGVFFLRSLTADSSIPSDYRHEYLAPPRKKELRKNRILTISSDVFAAHNGHVAEVPLRLLMERLDDGLYGYKGYEEIGDDVAIHSFVVVKNENLILSYRSGRYRPSTDPIHDSRSVGLGGAVLESDPDMLYESMVGIISNGIDELGYGIGLPSRLAEIARYENRLQPHTAVLSPASKRHPAVIHVVLLYSLPSEFEPSKTALSINDLRWISALKLPNSLTGYDKTSQFLMSTGIIRRLILDGE